MDLAHGRMRDAVFHNALALQHNMPDHQEGNRKLEMGSCFVPCSDRYRLSDLLCRGRNRADFRPCLISN